MSAELFDRVSLRQRASSVIGAGPVKIPVKMRNDEIRLRDLTQVVRCSKCDHQAVIESPCINVTTGQAQQFIRCCNKNCRHAVDILESYE